MMDILYNLPFFKDQDLMKRKIYKNSVKKIHDQMGAE